jgi:polyhydroxyalkanoate synthesis regulator phasin
VGERKRQAGGLGKAPDALRTAIEQTFEATAGSAAQGRERAAAMVDELVELGQEARGTLEKQSRRARKLIKRRRMVAERAVDDLRSAIEQIQRKIQP